MSTISKPSSARRPAPKLPGWGKLLVSQGPRNETEDPEPHPHRRVICMDDVVAEEVKWLWYPYIPAGKLTCLEGDPGLGKSWITCALSAAISKGDLLPGQKLAMPPQKVLMLSAEDGLADTIRPRLETMNANMKNIFVPQDFFILDAQGIRETEELMMDVAATIVFVDPIVAYMGAKIDMHRANEVRGLMAVLAEAAKRAGCAVVIVRHFRKGAGGKNIYKGIGSIDFTASVRSVIQVDEDDAGVHYMHHEKSNLAPKGPAITYSLENGTFAWGSTYSAPEKSTAKTNTKPKLVKVAQEWLFEILKNGPVSALTIADEAIKAGITQSTLNRAKQGLAYSKKSGGDEWVWDLIEREGIAAAPLKAGDPIEIVITASPHVGAPPAEAGGLDPEVLRVARERLAASKRQPVEEPQT